MIIHVSTSFKALVIKIGTSSLTGRDAGEAINHEVLNKLANTVTQIQNNGLNYKVVIVSSGAMGLGLAKLGLKSVQDIVKNGEHGNDLTSYKQALTAVGQVKLMQEYEEVFKYYSCHAGQVLVTHSGLHDKARASTIEKTIQKLFELNVIPIINENDTVCPDEIEFGDNDRLSAQVASIIKAERLFILTDCEGLYDADPHSNPDAKLISEINEITTEIRNIAGDSSTHIGSGGMKSKIMAAETCMDHKVIMHIISKTKLTEIPEILSGTKQTGTVFKAA